MVQMVAESNPALGQLATGQHSSELISFPNQES